MCLSGKQPWIKEGANKQNKTSNGKLAGSCCECDLEKKCDGTGEEEGGRTKEELQDARERKRENESRVCRRWWELWRDE